ncbi:hypothetical protein PCASD_19175 [Puccinia coronata f. sp. avenae]|uniref:Retrotransposon gag domain-containing protein n=1 Tax=Puccinia coronata f. sp. avenae TaxID=200324 RepID=A0A2N5TY78_9BASI|nr:hypothetical protein PCASD_19175 [Puccinia coronata f. sp. avenae]
MFHPTTAKSFISHLEEVFNNKHDVEEAKKRLFFFKQGNRTIEEFNALFNSLAYSVNLTKDSCCDLYKKALNPKVLKIAVMRSDWKAATKLKDKQLLAISAAEAQDKISSIDLGLLPSIHRRPTPLVRPNPPPTPSPVRVPDGAAPMDLDNISSNSSFTFPKFRSLCVQQGICQRCGQSFDEAHKKVRSCTLPDNKHMDIKQKLELFRRWFLRSSSIFACHSIKLFGSNSHWYDSGEYGPLVYQSSSFGPHPSSKFGGLLS